MSPSFLQVMASLMHMLQGQYIYIDLRSAEHASNKTLRSRDASAVFRSGNSYRDGAKNPFPFASRFKQNFFNTFD